jgi:hypothetical protein
MSARLATRFTNSNGTEDLTALFFQSGSTGTVTIRLYNDSDNTIAYNYLTVLRGDMIESGLTITGEDKDTSNGLGEELAADGWLEASLDNVTFAAVDSWARKFTIGSIAAGAYATIYLRLVLPASYDSFGMVAFNVCCASTNEV